MRKHPKQERSRALVDAVVEAAARVFEREGLDATTNRIAAEAGVSIGSLYQYFADKEALLEVLAERHMASIAAAFEQARPQMRDAPDLEAGLRALVAPIVAEHHARPAMQKLVRDHGQRAPAVMRRNDALRATLEAELVALIVRTAPEVPDPPRRVALLFDAVGGVLHRGRVDRPLPAAVDDTMALCIGWLRAGRDPG